MKKFFQSVCLVGLFASSSSFALFSVSGVGGLNRSSPSLSSGVAGADLSSSAGNSYALGALAGISVFPTLELESGLMLLNNKHKNTTTIGGLSVSSTTQAKSLHIPLLLRFVALPYVSFGAGAFYEKGMGKIKTSTAGVSESSSYATSGVKDTNFGLSADVRLHYEIAVGLEVIADFRYNLGLTNLDKTAPGSHKTRNILATAGLAFAL